MTTTQSFVKAFNKNSKFKLKVVDLTKPPTPTLKERIKSFIKKVFN